MSHWADNLFPHTRNVKSPLDPEMLRPLDPCVEFVQVDGDLEQQEWRVVADFLRAYPQVIFRVYGHRGPRNLDFLDAFPFVRRFHVNLFELEDIRGLAFLPEDLEYLSIGQTRTSRHSLRFLSRFAALRELKIEKHTKDLDAISSLARLEKLTLRSITLPDFSLLLPLQNLWWLAIKLGGTRNLGALPRIGRLRYLELWMINGLSDISAVGEIEGLQYIFLQDLPRITALPSFARLRVLRRVHLESLKGLVNLRGLGHAPALQDLMVLAAKHLQPDQFRYLKGHPALRGASIDLGSDQRNLAVERLLGLPPASALTAGFDFR